MGSRSALHASACLIQRLLAGLCVLVIVARVAHSQTSQDPQALLKEATSLHQAGKLDQAIEAYRLFLQQYPDIAPVRSNLGAALAGAGRYEEAIAEYQRALQLKPLPEVQLNLGLAYYKTAQLNSAVEAFEKARQDLPGDSRPTLLLADCYLRLGENKKVIGLLRPLQQASQDDLGIVY